MSKVYVAYGSNLNLIQMEERCPGAEICGLGWLRNWKLVYRGSKTGAYATIIRSKGDSVPVVMWSITEQDEKNLDLYEGYPIFYHKQNVFVQTLKGKKKGMVYIMHDKAIPGIPSGAYLRTVLDGYYHNGIDETYFWKSIEYNKKECKY